MTLVNLLAKKRISRELFKVCRLNGIASGSEIERYFQQNGSFEKLQWCSPELRKELECFVNADLIRLGRKWKIPEDLLQSQSIIPIVEFLLEEPLFPERQMEIFKSSCRIYSGQKPKTIFEIASTSEMEESNIRGLRSVAISRMTKHFRSLQVIQEDLLFKYGLETSSGLILIDEAIARKVNGSANSNFTPEFLAWLFGTYLEGTYSLLGRPSEVLAGNFMGNRHYWSGFYLLKTELAEILDFDAFLGETFRLLHNGAREDRHLSFRTFVSHFSRPGHRDQIEVVLPCATEILSRELGLRLRKEGRLLLPKQGKSLIRDYCLEALNALGEPAIRGSIRRKMSEIHPEVYIDLAGFGSVMLAEYGFTRYRNIIGLQKWLPKGKRSLKLQKEPVLVDLQKKFPVRSAEYWKAYWDENWKILLAFVEAHSRLPGKQAAGEEAAVRKFWQMQVSRCGRGKLAPEYQILLNDLRRRFPVNKKVHWKVDWDDRFEKIKAFAEAHGVPPHCEGPGEEKTFNGWLQAQRARMKKGNLDRRQEVLIKRFDELYHLKKPAHFERQWDRNYKELVVFGQTHQRLPREVIKEEKSLNRWFAAQRLRISKGTLDRRRSKLILKIIEQYPLMGIEYLKGRWHEKCAELERFAELHSRVPKATVKEEKVLYAWYTKQKLQGIRGKLDSQQQERLQKISETYSVEGHFEKHFDERLGELEDFIRIHNRLPRKSAPGEESLYHWFMQQLRRGEAGKLNTRQRDLLKKLCEPYQEVKTDWKERFRQVKSFAEMNSRLPKRTALTKEEKVLNRWFVCQKGRLKNGTLVRRERKLIQYLVKRYGTGPGGRKLEEPMVLQTEETEIL